VNRDETAEFAEVFCHSDNDAAFDRDSSHQGVGQLGTTVA
jgi:hypothetical protein